MSNRGVSNELSNNSSALGAFGASTAKPQRAKCQVALLLSGGLGTENRKDGGSTPPLATTVEQWSCSVAVGRCEAGRRWPRSRRGPRHHARPELVALGGGFSRTSDVLLNRSARSSRPSPSAAAGRVRSSETKASSSVPYVSSWTGPTIGRSTSSDRPGPGRGADPQVPRSSERPASRRDHCAMGRPLVRNGSALASQHGCGQPAGVSSHASRRP